jgi:hypothetical protein
MGPTSIKRGQQRPDDGSFVITEFSRASVEFLCAGLHRDLIVVSNVIEPAGISTASSIGPNHKVPSFVQKIEQRIRPQVS